MAEGFMQRTRKIAIAHSGGGHRASLFGLGVLMYLTDARCNRQVESISSVSGGSLTNAWLAQTGDYSNLTADELESQVVRPFVRQLAHCGTLWASWTTWLYVISLFICFLAVFALWCLPIDHLMRAVIFLFGLAAWGLLASLRGKVCARAFNRTLFSKNGHPTLLRHIQSENVQHVICATDLRAGYHVYFSGDFIYSFRLGWGCPADFRLADAVQVSAALPVAFPPRWLPTNQHEFVGGFKASRYMVLSDGGVYDNMAEQWPIGVPDRKSRCPKTVVDLKEPNVLVVVNASGRLLWSRFYRLCFPVIGEFFALFRVISVLYDKTTTTRRSSLFHEFERAAQDKQGLEGAFIMINQSPYFVADHYIKETETWPDRAVRASRVLEVLGEKNREEWEQMARENSRVKTKLSRLGSDVSAKLLYHGYVSAMANLHVVLGFPLLKLPSLDRFRGIAAKDT